MSVRTSLKIIFRTLTLQIIWVSEIDIKLKMGLNVGRLNLRSGYPPGHQTRTPILCSVLDHAM